MVPYMHADFKGCGLWLCIIVEQLIIISRANQISESPLADIWKLVITKRVHALTRPKHEDCSICVQWAYLSPYIITNKSLRYGYTHTQQQYLEVFTPFSHPGFHLHVYCIHSRCTSCVYTSHILDLLHCHYPTICSPISAGWHSHSILWNIHPLI